MSVWWVVPPTSSATVSGKSGASRAPVFTGGGSDARSRRARRPVGPLTGMLQPDSSFAKTDLIGPRASLTGRRILQVELRHGSRHDEIAVVKAERARNAVLVELEADSVGRGLFAGLGGALLEIADGEGPALETGQRFAPGAVDLQLWENWRCVPSTAAPGKIKKNASPPRLEGSLAMRFKKLEVVDGAMRRERSPCRSRRRGGKAGPRHQRGCNHLQSDL